MSKKTKKLLTFLLCTVLSITTIGLAVKVGKLETTKELTSVAYSTGGINVEDGTEVKNDYALRTDYLESAKFDEIIISKDAKITYQVFYFDNEKSLIGKTEALSVDLTEIPKTQNVVDVSTAVKYFRIMIIVPESEQKVTLLNKGDYVKQLTVTVKK